MPTHFPIAYTTPHPDRDRAALTRAGWFPAEASAIARFARDSDLSLTEAERLAGWCLRAGWDRVSYSLLLSEHLSLHLDLPPRGSLLSVVA